MAATTFPQSTTMMTANKCLSSLRGGRSLNSVTGFLLLVISLQGPFLPILSRIMLYQQHEETSGYGINDHVPLSIGTVGPFENPHEMYDVGKASLKEIFPFFCSFASSKATSNTTTTTASTKIETYKTLPPSDPLWLPFRLYVPMTDLGYKIRLPSSPSRQPEQHQRQQRQACTIGPLTTYQYQNLDYAIRHRWFYRLQLGRMYNPDVSLPINGMLGEILPSKKAGNTTSSYASSSASLLEASGLFRNQATIDKDQLSSFIYTRRHLTIRYCIENDVNTNNNIQHESDRSRRQYYHIHQADLTNDVDGLQKIKAGEPISFNLDVTWINESSDDHLSCSRLLPRNHWGVHSNVDRDNTTSSRWINVITTSMLVATLVLLLHKTSGTRDENRRRYMFNDKKRSSDIPSIDDDSGINDSTFSSFLRKPLLESIADSPYPSKIDNIQAKAMENELLFEEPPSLPFLASLIGTGSQLLIISWLVVCHVSLRPDDSGYIWTGDNSRLFLSSLWITWLGPGSLVAGFSSTIVVLLYARSTKIKEDVVDVFEDELVLEMNAMSDDDDDDDEYSRIVSPSHRPRRGKFSAGWAFHDKSSNDEEIYVSRMIQWTMGWTVSIIPLLHGVVIALLGTLAGLKGAYLGINPGGILASILSWMLFGVPMCIIGSNFAQRQMARRRLTTSNSSVDQAVNASTNTDWLHTKNRFKLLSWFPIRLLVLACSLISSIPTCQEISGFIFDSYFGYRMYVPTVSILIMYLLCIATVGASSQLTMQYMLRERNGQMDDIHWQWLAFACGGMTCIFVVSLGLYKLWWIQPSINGWYECFHSITVIIVMSIDVGLVTGTISYFVCQVAVRSLLQHKSI